MKDFRVQCFQSLKAKMPTLNCAQVNELCCLEDWYLRYLRDLVYHSLKCCSYHRDMVIVASFPAFKRVSCLKFRAGMERAMNRHHCVLELGS